MPGVLDFKTFECFSPGKSVWVTIFAMPILIGIAMGVAKRFDLLMVIEIFKFEATNHFAPISGKRACKNSHLFNRLKFFDFVFARPTIFFQPVERCEIFLEIFIWIFPFRQWQFGTGSSVPFKWVIKNFLTYLSTLITIERVNFIFAHISDPLRRIRCKSI